MRDGFVKVAAATLNTKVADVEHNKWEIFRLIDETIENGAKIVVFPELCITDTPVETYFHRTFC